jgi:basic membrane protein A
MRRLIEQKNSLIIAASFGYADSTTRLAKEYPDVRFMQVFGPETAANLAPYAVKMYQVWYAMGVAAGRATKTNQVGFVAGHPVPPLIWYMNVFMKGARSVNPKTELKVTYINHWFDPSLSSQAADALVNQGTDVIAGLLDNSVAVAQVAERRGVWLIGHNTDLSRFAPTKYLVGTEWLWGPLYVRTIEAIFNKEQFGGNPLFIGGLKEGYLGITGFGPNVPPALKDEVRQAVDRVAADDSFLYDGPMRTNKGVEIVKAGERLPFTVGVDWYAEGISAPK